MEVMVSVFPSFSSSFQTFLAFLPFPLNVGLEGKNLELFAHSVPSGSHGTFLPFLEALWQTFFYISQ